MKQYLFLLGICLFAFFVACKQDSGGQTQAGVHNDLPTLLAGNWIAMDFCSRVNQYGSVLDAMTYSHVPYAYGISFDPNRPDSAVCYNGIEEWTLPVKFKADTLELVGARPGKSVFLVYHSKTSKDITMFDATTGSVQMDKFIKSNATARNGYGAFMVALNHNLFAGMFTPVGKSAGTAKDGKEVQFTPGGFIMNWKPYDRYEVCTAGDCFVSGNDIDVITLSKRESQAPGTLFGFRYAAQNDTLTLYNLVDTNPDEKGAYQIKGIAYQFLRKRTEQY